MIKPWTPESVLELCRSYQEACVIAAAADLDLFTALSQGPQTAAELAKRLQADLRGLTILLDALAALELIEKLGAQYAMPPAVRAVLTPEGGQSVLAMAQHQANCLRRWANLARVIKTGRPAERAPSVRGEAADAAAFIGAMHDLSGPVAAEVIGALQPLSFQHLLDVGGASGSWTMAFLRACPGAIATIFDLPHVIPMATRRLEAAGFAPRVRLVAGDFQHDPLPPGADLAWISAIVHQNSRAQNGVLLANVFRALVPGGRVAIRDIVMDASRTKPVAGALFAVNMLVATEGGGTFTLDELREDLEGVGFREVALVRRDEGMHSIIVATKPRA